MRFRPLLLVAVVVALAAASAAALAQSWTRQFNGVTVTSMQAQPDNMILAAGWAYDSYGNSGGWLASLYPSGVVEWQQTIATSQTESFGRAVRCADGSIVAVGTTGPSSGPYSGWIVKFSAGGALLWQRQLSSSPQTILRSLAAGGDGSIVAVGERTLPSGDIDALVVRVSAGGALLSEFQLGTASVDRFHEVRRTEEGGYVAAGETGVGLGSTDIWLVNFDSDLNVLWQRAYGGAYQETFGGFSVGPTGDYFLGMRTDSFGGVSYDALVLKLVSGGGVAWARRFDRPVSGLGSELLGDVAATIDGGCYITGSIPYTVYMGYAVHAAWLARLDADGSVLWQATPGIYAYSDGYGQRVWTLPDGSFLTTHRPAVSLGYQLVRLLSGGPGAMCQDGPAVLSPLAQTVGSTQTAASRVDDSLTLVDGSAVVTPRPDDLLTRCLGRPLEISAPGSRQPLRFVSKTVLAWEDAIANNATTFNLYRGSAEGLAGGDYGYCFRSAIAAPTKDDTEAPDAGDCFTYLVTGYNSSGEGPLGRTSAGVLRSNLHPCP